MRTRILPIDPHHPEPGVLDEAVRVLRAGGLVAFPTETVYGLGGRSLDERSIARIFEAKGRPKAHPLIAHVLGEDEARALAASWSPRASHLAKAFWPGPLTLVVPRASHVPAASAGGGDSIAVRAPANTVARALLAALGEPLSAPSANRYQSLSPTTAEHVQKTLGGRIELILDGGPCAAGIESTVVDVRGDRARVLRPGALDLAALREAEPDIEADAHDVARDASRASPGMDPRHYAPHARLLLAEDRARAVSIAASHRDRGDRTALVVRGPVALEAVDVRVLHDDPALFAAELFAALHDLDDAGAQVVVVESVPRDEAWLAVADRLRRAATPAT